MPDRQQPAPIEVVYALPHEQRVVYVAYRQGITAEEAVRLAGLATAYPEIDEQPLVLGVFGTRVALDHTLAAGDRVEICRPLLRDPRDRRRNLAVKKRG